MHNVDIIVGFKSFLFAIEIRRLFHFSLFFYLVIHKPLKTLTPKPIEEIQGAIKPIQ
jgi:hypothetical protein